MKLKDLVTNSKLIPTPKELHLQYPVNVLAKEKIINSRRKISEIIHKESNEILFISGPCALDFSGGIIDYIEELEEFKKNISDKIILIYRTVPLKPRTHGGWRGTMQDSIINTRKLIVKLVNSGYLVAMDVLSMEQFSFFCDVVSFFWVGARYSAVQELKLLASLFYEVPVLFKNGMDSSIESAVDAIKFARSSHDNIPFLDYNGNLRLKNQSFGNSNCSIILRGGKVDNQCINNLTRKKILEIENICKNRNLPNNKILFDVTHDNGAYYTNNIKTTKGQIESYYNALNLLDYNTIDSILGFMIESYIFEGNIKTRNYEKGVSLVDPTINIKTVKEFLLELSEKIEKICV